MTDPPGAVPEGAGPTKSELRWAMRELRRSLPDRTERSVVLWRHVRAIPEVERARRVLLFATVPGEPETIAFVDWCVAAGKDVAMPEDDVDASWPDVVIVPGLAFTSHGDRLGQGGGWYDRFLSEVRDDCTTVGVGFSHQILDTLPIEPHDARLDHVVTEAGLVTGRVDSAPNGRPA
jgi:5-formyltetrahydrofolate cyclo-ligase